jgi:integrase
LRWRNVDLTAGRLAVVESVEQTKAGLRFKPPKSDAGVRPVALSPTAVAALRAHRLRQAEELLRLGIRLAGDHLVVARFDGQPMLPRSLTHEWQKLVARHGLRRIRFHDLRHTHASHMPASNVHPKVASERLGHSSIGITLDLYSHCIPSLQSDAVAVVDGALNEAITKRANGVG